MKAIVEFELHDYMDMYPEKHMREFVGTSLQQIEECSRAWAEYMNQAYSGGTTRFVKVYSKEESIKHCMAEIQDVLNNPKVHTDNGSLDEVDVTYLKTITGVLDYFLTTKDY